MELISGEIKKIYIFSILMIKNNHNTFLYYMYEKKNYHTLLLKKQKRLSGINM